MTIKVGESGKILRVSADGFDMSSNTELTLDFILPDATTSQKLTGDGVSLGTGAVTDPDLGALTANTYVEWEPDSTFWTQSGTWQVRLTYTNTTPTPDDIYIGEYVSFTVTDPDT